MRANRLYYLVYAVIMLGTALIPAHAGELLQCPLCRERSHSLTTVSYQIKWLEDAECKECQVVSSKGELKACDECLRAVMRWWKNECVDEELNVALAILMAKEESERRAVVNRYRSRLPYCWACHDVYYSEPILLLFDEECRLSRLLAGKGRDSVPKDWSGARYEICQDCMRRWLEKSRGRELNLSTFLMIVK